MARTRYPKELKERVIREALETGNVAAVARRHELKVSVVYSWMRQHRLSTETGSEATSNPGGGKAQRALEKENARLKSLLGEKELEIAILKDLVKKTNRR